MEENIDLNISPPVASAIGKLLQSLGPERLVKLADLIREVEQETGYGDVKIVVAEHVVQRLKAEKSY